MIKLFFMYMNERIRNIISLVMAFMCLLCIVLVIEYGKAVFWYVFFVLTLMWLLLFIDDKFIDDNDKKD